MANNDPLTTVIEFFLPFQYGVEPAPYTDDTELFRASLHHDYMEEKFVAAFKRRMRTSLCQSGTECARLAFLNYEIAEIRYWHTKSYLESIRKARGIVA